MKNMEVPPIPPGCRFFIEYGNNKAIGFGMPDAPPGCFDAIGALNEHERHIAACVARCKWLDEAERINVMRDELEGQIGPDKPEKCGEFSSLYTLQVMAEENAEKWREWGQAE